MEYTKSFTGGYEDIFTGVCCVQDNIIDTESLFVTQYDFSISNNGLTFVNYKSVYVLDSTCQEGENTSFDNASFSLKTGFCFINGSCTAEKEMAPVGCLACQSIKDKYNWTDYNPCQNGGYCTDETNGYSCVCVDGYGGKNCEIDIDECSSDPCTNGGTCKDLVNGYECTCIAGYDGTTCDNNIDECSNDPCKNGGTCTDLVNGYECECVPGYDTDDTCHNAQVQYRCNPDDSINVFNLPEDSYLFAMQVVTDGNDIPCTVHEENATTVTLTGCSKV
ncbi:fibropellin-1-like [Ruditapes philippinarum]|uniref:fibropellin-1-like n=1 Tax=Ruditapes philippinarum TaxID=129788 RepID=UPI00295BE49A|nr:fibropellin-1-like [Ruditapes philippinarum]